MLTQEELKQAREWLADCVWADLEPEDFAALADTVIEWGIRKHWDGGIESFKLACVPVQMQRIAQ